MIMIMTIVIMMRVITIINRKRVLLFYQLCDICFATRKSCNQKNSPLILFLQDGMPQFGWQNWAFSSFFHRNHKTRI